jgi:four helix bundle protein
MRPFEQALMERRETYALRIIRLYRALPAYPAAGYQGAQTLGRPLLCSGPSVGANYAEAIRSHSLADKAATQQMCIKALEETASWLRLLDKAPLVAAPRLAPLLPETSAVTAIFVASVRTLQREA